MSKLISMYQDIDKPELNYPGGPEEALYYDVAVVGGGGSGAVAAVRAAELGAKVILIEKMEVLGGNSRFAGGLLSTYSRFQKEKGMPDKTGDYIKTAYRHHRYTLDPAIFRRYIANTGTFLEWIADHGFDMENTRWAMDAVCMIKDRKDPGPLNNPAYGPGLMGSVIVDVLKENLEKLGVTTLAQTKVRSLITDEKGAVTGLLADGQGKSCRIAAGAVILATGNFTGNADLLLRWAPRYFASDNYIAHYGLMSMTGDGITMAEKIGAQTGENISVGIYALTHIPGAYTLQRVIAEPVGTIVNKNGRRFVSEDDTAGSEEAVDLQPEGLAYYLLDGPGMEEAWRLVLEHVRYGDRVPTRAEFDGDIARENEVGLLRVSDTLEGLAAYIGCTPEALKQIAAACSLRFEARFDGELFKAPEHLRKLEKPPFYAIRLQRNFDVTMGGVSINENTQVLRPDKTVISGLHAIGDTASGWMGREYGPIFSSFAWAMNSGYIAAEEAVKALRN